MMLGNMQLPVRSWPLQMVTVMVSRWTRGVVAAVARPTALMMVRRENMLSDLSSWSEKDLEVRMVLLCLLIAVELAL